MGRALPAAGRLRRNPDTAGTLTRLSVAVLGIAGQWWVSAGDVERRGGMRTWSAEAVTGLIVIAVAAVVPPETRTAVLALAGAIDVCSLRRRRAAESGGCSAPYRAPLEPSAGVALLVGAALFLGGTGLALLRAGVGRPTVRGSAPAVCSAAARPTGGVPPTRRSGPA